MKRFLQARRVLLLVLGLALVAAATGCNTMRGMGQDVEEVGEEISGDD